MKFEFTTNGLMSLQDLDRPIAKRIVKKLTFWESTDHPLHYAKRYEGYSNEFIFRIGDWRVIASPNFNKDTIDILRVGNRRNVYNTQ